MLKWEFFCFQCEEEFEVEDVWQMMPVSCTHCGSQFLIINDEDDEGGVIFYLEPVEADEGNSEIDAG